MAFDADLDTIWNPGATTPTVAWGDAINANLAAFGPGMSTYTPGLTNSGTAPTGWTVNGYHITMGKTLFLVIYAVAGASTTDGADWAFDLPSGVNLKDTNIGFGSGYNKYYGAASQMQSNGVYVTFQRTPGDTGTDYVQPKFCETGTVGDFAPMSTAGSTVWVMGVTEIA